jgi:hypothetical protein
MCIRRTQQVGNWNKTLSKCGISVFKLLLASAILLVSPSFVVLSLLINYLIPKAVDFLAHRFHTEEEGLGLMLSSHSSLLAADDIYKQPAANMLSLSILEGTLTLERLRDLWHTNVMEARIPDTNTNMKNEEKLGKRMYPELTQFLYNWGGYSFWKEDLDFDLNKHINYLSLDNSNENEELDQILPKLREELLNRPWMRNKPLWEVFLIPVKSEQNNQTVLIIRCHHSLADGYAMLNLFLSKLCKTLDFEIPKPNLVTKKRSGLLKKIGWVLLFPFRGAYVLAEQAVMAMTYSVFRTNPPSSNEDYTCLHKTLSPLSVELIKKIKSHHGVSFASVLHSLATSVLQELLRLKGIDEFPELVPALCILPLKGHPLLLTNHM